MEAIVSVIGKDKKGIIARVSTILYKRNINIMDISQTILKEYFTMIMITDLSEMTVSFSELAEELDNLGAEIGVSIRIQHQDIFDAMHNIDKE
ncbi:MAG TPA: ACT domain-containing protein [Eubacteriaceae bacterium]|jgi:ACT domain-containing protein|nr:ACT domain-containing protein [Eubacteriaceae bacterium]